MYIYANDLHGLRCMNHDDVANFEREKIRTNARCRHLYKNLETGTDVPLLKSVRYIYGKLVVHIFVARLV